MKGIGDERVREFDTVDEIEDTLQALRDEGATIFHGSLQDYAMELVDGLGGLSELDPQTLENHFDWESYARDLEHQSGIHDLGGGTILVTE